MSMFSKITPVAALSLAIAPVAITAAPTSLHTKTSAIHADQLADHFSQATDGIVASATLQGSSKDLGIPVAKYNVEFSGAPKAFAMVKGNNAEIFGVTAHFQPKAAHSGYQQSGAKFTGYHQG